MTLILGVLRLVALVVIVALMVAYTIVLIPILYLAVMIERIWKGRKEKAGDLTATG